MLHNYPYCTLILFWYGMYSRDATVLIDVNYSSTFKTRCAPTAGCGHVPGLLKLFYKKCVCVRACMRACVRACVCVPIYVRIHPSIYLTIHICLYSCEQIFEEHVGEKAKWILYFYTARLCSEVVSFWWYGTGHL